MVERIVKSSGGRVVGYIVRCDHGSFFVQRRVVPRGACVSYGLNVPHMRETDDARIRG